MFILREDGLRPLSLGYAFGRGRIWPMEITLVNGCHALSRENFRMAASGTMLLCGYFSRNRETILRHRLVSENFFAIFINTFFKAKEYLRVKCHGKTQNNFILCIFYI